MRLHFEYQMVRCWQSAGCSCFSVARATARANSGFVTQANCKVGRAARLELVGWLESGPCLHEALIRWVWNPGMISWTRTRALCETPCMHQPLLKFSMCKVALSSTNRQHAPVQSRVENLMSSVCKLRACILDRFLSEEEACC